MGRSPAARPPDARRRRRADRSPDSSAIPLLLRSDQIIKASAVGVYAIIGLSLVVLTGWAGQISLGQMGFVAIGAAVAGKCTSEWNVDLTLALLAGGAAGAVAAFVVGLPALRLRGLYLAVTTLVFALAVSSWLLNDLFFGWVPRQRLERPPLFGRIDISTPTRYYVFTLVVFGARLRRACAVSATVARDERSSACARTNAPPRRTRCRRYRSSSRRSRSPARSRASPAGCSCTSPRASTSPATARSRASTSSPPAWSAGSDRCSAVCSARSSCAAPNGSSPSLPGSSCRRRSVCCSCCSSCRAAWRAS